MSKPKFSVGQTVKLKSPTLYNETVGVITSFERLFKEVDSSGKFETDGLTTLETTIHSFAVPYKLEGNVLEVYMPESRFKLADGGEFYQPARTKVSMFYGYAYTIKTPKMNSIYSERQLAAIK